MFYLCVGLQWKMYTQTDKQTQIQQGTDMRAMRMPASQCKTQTDKQISRIWQILSVRRSSMEDVHTDRQADEQNIVDRICVRSYNVRQLSVRRSSVEDVRTDRQTADRQNIVEYSRQNLY